MTASPSDCAPVTSPCVKVCAVDDATGLCRGCGRTLTEIGAWPSMSEIERRAVMTDLPRRMRRLSGAG